MAFFEMQQWIKKGQQSQKLIDIAEIRDDVVILNDGTLRSILLVSSINFALKSEEEQNAIIYAYQDFLNSLDFPVQIIVSSRNVDIAPYLEEVRQRRQQNENELLRLQMDEYINFVAELVKTSNIMTKTFFIVIPFAVQQSKREGMFSRFFKGVKAAAGTYTMNEPEFLHNRSQLFQRVEQVAIGLQGFGLRVVPLKTKELFELYYTLYNPVTGRNQHVRPLTDIRVQETEPPL